LELTKGSRSGQRSRGVAMDICGADGDGWRSALFRRTKANGRSASVAAHNWSPSAVLTATVFLLAVGMAAGAEPSAAPGLAAAPIPPGCWDVERAERLEKSLNAFFASKDPAERAALYLSEVAPLQPGLSLEELEALGRGGPPEDGKTGKSGTWRVHAPWAKDNPRAWFNIALPKGYSPARPWGLVMVLHSGPAGNDADNLVDIYTPSVNDAGFLAVYPTILDDRRWWADPNERAWVYRILEWVARRYRLDFRRLVVTGGSAGGIGTWNHLALHPEVWCAGASGAAMPGAQPKDFPKFKDIPFYLVQGTQDPFIEHVRAAVKGLSEIGGRYKYTEIADAGHELPNKAWSDLAAWIPRQATAEPKPYSPRPLILPPPGERSLWMRIADPMKVADDPILTMMKEGKFTDARKALDARIAARPGVAKDYMMRAVARIPALTKPLPDDLDPRKMKEGEDGWGGQNENAALEDLSSALHCREGKGEDPESFDARVHLLTAKILAKRFSAALASGGYGWVHVYNRCANEINAASKLDPSNRETAALAQSVFARLPKPQPAPGKK
ncbi:MAG: hypothetical protein N3A38_15665, partial [Planctomycetota bacterium]|nr:hypothetical protein [Planctomycetota bacterium]